MIRRCSELHNPNPSSNITSNAFPTKTSTNGHTDVFDEDMELDDDNDDDNDSFQMANTSNGDAEPEGEEEEYHNIPTDSAKYDELLQEAMSYGQTLMREYRDEKREYRKTLEDIFSLIAYDDAKASVHGHLLETGGRVQVAEELNSAILGKNSSVTANKSHYEGYGANKACYSITRSLFLCGPGTALSAD